MNSNWLRPGATRQRILLALLAACAMLPALAQEPRPTLQAGRFTTPPVLDGEVRSDPAWAGFEAASGFRQVRPDAGEPASEATEVYVGFSEDALYVGVVAHDRDAASLTTNDSRRDASLEDADAFLVIFDALLDRQNGFVFGTNPAGMQYDGQVVKEGSGSASSFDSGGINLNWDGSWDVAAAQTGSGWSAEMRIPFRTLRFGRGDKQTWGVNFQRNIRRRQEKAYWAPLSREHKLYRVSDAGTVTGISPPSLRNLQFTPYILGRKIRGGDVAGSETDTDGGFDIKYSITPSLTLDATYNTDFAQVETDDQQLNLDRFSLFFPEKRPFFLENAGQFTVGEASRAELFFSRRIGIGPGGVPIPIDGGLRLSGKVGNSTNVGLLHMRSAAVEDVAPGNDFSVARVNRELPNRSSIGFLVVDRQGDGSFDRPADEDDNQTYALDGRWGIGDNFVLSGWLARTDTPGYTGRDDAFGLAGDYADADWSGSFTYMEIGGDFNPEVGFLPRSDVRFGQVALLRRIRPDDWLGLFEIRPHFSYTGWWELDGFQQSGFLHVDTHWEFRNGYEVHTGYNHAHEGVTEAFEIVPGVTVDPGIYDDGEAQLVFKTNPAAPLSFEISSNIGGRFGGDRVAINPSITYQVGETFSSKLSYHFNDYDLANGSFQANLARLRLSYSFTPKILLQALVQYNELRDVVGTNLRFSWLRTANSGLYLVYNEVDERGVDAPARGREFILKYSHIFDVLR